MKEVFTTGEVARICSVGSRTVVKWFDTGRLRGYRVPGSRDRRVPRASLAKFLADNGLDAAALDAFDAAYAARQDG